ncbi:MAG: hypothetical protein ACJ75F_00305 [Flavisolibacter sp.]|jgi:hypothetical protein
MKGIILGLFTVLLVGAVYFSLQRILFCDASLILFRIINYHSFQIQEHRYGSFITQFIPLIAAQLHLPLHMIVVLYSISFNMFYLGVALILIFRYRQIRLALLMAFYFVLFVSDTYFWTNNEVHQGIAWMFLCFGTYNYLKETNKSWMLIIPFFTILSFLALFTHPLVVFPCIFLWIFFLHRKEPISGKKLSILLSLILLVICFLKYRTSTDTSGFYDAEKLNVFNDLKFSDLIHSFTSPMAKQIFYRCLSNYWLVPLLFFTGIYSTIRQKQYAVVILTLVFCVVYFMAVCLTFQDFIPFYMESEWMPLSIIATTPFVCYTLPQWKPRTGIAVITIIFLIRLTYIFFASEKFTERKDTLFSLLKKMDSEHLNKGIIYANDNYNKIFIMNWGVPAESILASAFRHDHPQKNFVFLPLPDTTVKIPSDPHILIVPFRTMHDSDLNKRYFEIDTSEGYRVLKD